MNTTISSRYWKSKQYQDDIGKVKYDNSNHKRKWKKYDFRCEMRNEKL